MIFQLKIVNFDELLLTVSLIFCVCKRCAIFTVIMITLIDVHMCMLCCFGAIHLVKKMCSNHFAIGSPKKNTVGLRLEVPVNYL